MIPTDQDEYQCAVCGEVFKKPPGDDDLANAEAKEIFGVDRASERSDMVVVCDTCWRKIRPYGDGGA